MFRLNVFILATLLVVAAACGSEKSPTAPTPDDSSAMSAMIDGAVWNSASSPTVVYSNGTLSLSGSSSTTPPQAIGFALVVTAGTYPVGPGNLTGANAVLTIGTARWQAAPLTGTGSITIDKLTATGASGSVSFTRTPIPNTTATGTRIVSNGTFDVTF